VAKGNTQHLTYSTQAIAEIEERLRNNGYVAGFETHLMRWVVEELRKAPKFLMPEGGRIIDSDSTFRLFDAARLPYHCVALEFHVRQSNVAAIDSPSSKRIALVWDDKRHKAVAPPIEAGQGGDPDPEDRLLHVFCLYRHDESGMWLFSPAISEINLDKQPERIDIEEYSRGNEGQEQMVEIMRQRDAATGMKFSKKRWLVNQRLIPFFVSIMASMIEKMGVESASATMRADSNDEVITALDFAAMSGCANVEHEEVPAPAALNKKRSASGKPPFFPYRVLWVRDSGYEATGVQGSPGPGGTHASPRAHLRRGHIRQLEHKAIWINATVVNAGQSKLETPSYQLRKRMH